MVIGSARASYEEAAHGRLLGLQFTQRELLDLGHEVVTVANAKTVIVGMEQRPFDIVITETRMPGMDGIQAQWPRDRWDFHQIVIVTTLAGRRGAR